MVLASGKYWFGDPCYQVSGEDWDKIDWDLAETNHAFWTERYIFSAFRTRWGDGEYFGAGMLGGTLVSGRFGVDSGMLGIVPLLEEDEPSDLGVVFESSEEFHFMCHHGVFMINSPKYNSFRVET